MGLVTRLSLPATEAAAEAVHLTISVIVAAILANADIAITTSPLRLTLADTTNAFSVVTAQMNAFQSRGFGGSITAVTDPSFLALAESRMNTLPSVGTAVETNGDVTVRAFPATEAVALVGFSARTMLASTAGNDRAVRSLITRGTSAESRNETSSTTRTITGANWG